MKKTLIISLVIILCVIGVGIFGTNRIIDYANSKVKEARENEVIHLSSKELAKEMSIKNNKKYCRKVVQFKVKVKNIDNIEKRLVLANEGRKEIAIGFQKGEDISNLKVGDTIKLRGLTTPIDKEGESIAVGGAVLLEED